MNTKEYDIAVLGGGPGGYPAAIRCAQHGKSVVLIEKKELGGTCLNRGCIPSKALIAGAESLNQIKKAHQFGISFDNLTMDFKQLAHHKEQVVNKMRQGLESLVKANQIELIQGVGKLKNRHEIHVSGENSCLIRAKQMILATGSEPRNIPSFPFDYKKIHDSTSLLELKTLPNSLVIIGGGVIGCEFASLYHTLGVKVTILELLPSLIPTESLSVSNALTKAFTKKGIQIVNNIQVESIDTSKDGVIIHTKEGSTFAAEIALVSVGRTLNTRGIGLESTGIAVLDNGLIQVNEKMETTIPGIYAVGDIASKWWLAHVASHQGIVAAENACGNLSKMSYEAIPSVIFTHPEIATVGLSLEAAKEKGHAATIGAFPFQALGKAEAMNETEGFAQIIIDEKTGQILGAQVVGFEASTLIAEITVAIANELTIESISETIHAHPTLPEAWLEAAFLAEKFPLHYPPTIKKKI